MNFTSQSPTVSARRVYLQILPRRLQPGAVVIAVGTFPRCCYELVFQFRFLLLPSPVEVVQARQMLPARGLKNQSSLAKRYRIYQRKSKLVDDYPGVNEMQQLLQSTIFKALLQSSLQIPSLIPSHSNQNLAHPTSNSRQRPKGSIEAHKLHYIYQRQRCLVNS